MSSEVWNQARSAPALNLKKINNHNVPVSLKKENFLTCRDFAETAS